MVKKHVPKVKGSHLAVRCDPFRVGIYAFFSRGRETLAPGYSIEAHYTKTDWLAIELINGFPSGLGLISLPERGAALRLRIPAEPFRFNWATR